MIDRDIQFIQLFLKEELQIDSIHSIVKLGGMTNRTYKIQSKDTYVVRIPGEGTADLINRTNERLSTKLACDLNIDTELIYFNDDGLKVTKFITNGITLNKDFIHNNQFIIKDIANLFKTLHSCGVDTGVEFDVFKIASEYESFILSKRIQLFDNYFQIKEVVLEINNELSNYNQSKVPCHNDPLCENWIYDGCRLFLIDWEYAGMNNYMWDLADISIEAEFDERMDILLLENYLSKSIDVDVYRHFLGNKIFIDYLWSLWGKTRVPFDGDSLNDYANQRFERLKSNLQKYKSTFE